MFSIVKFIIDSITAVGHHRCIVCNNTCNWVKITSSKLMKMRVKIPITLVNLLNKLDMLGRRFLLVAHLFRLLLQHLTEKSRQRMQCGTKKKLKNESPTSSSHFIFIMKNQLTRRTSATSNRWLHECVTMLMSTIHFRQCLKKACFNSLPTPKHQGKPWYMAIDFPVEHSETGSST